MGKRVVVAVAFAVLFAVLAHVQTMRYSVYTANTGSNDVSVYMIAPGTGALTAVGGWPFAEGAGWGMAIGTLKGP